MTGWTNKILSFGVSVVVLLCSCQKPLETKEYLAWLREPSNGFIKSTRMGDLVYEVQKRPLELIALSEGISPNDRERFDRRKEELAGLEYFELSIKTGEGLPSALEYGLKGQPEYVERMGYFSFGMKSSIKLVEGGRERECALYHFERDYNVTGVCRFLLAFETLKGAEDQILVFEDLVYGAGILKFRFEKEIEDKLPQLKGYEL